MRSLLKHELIEELINNEARELMGIFRNTKRAEMYKHIINTEAFLRSFATQLEKIKSGNE